MRTIVDLPPEQLGALARICAIQGISRAEAVRRAVGKMIADSAAPEKDVAFGIWRARKGDSRKLVASMREEWDKT